jgi:hypothetical protein
VFVAFGAPIPPEQACVAVARKAMLDLGAVAFEERPVLRRHLARECVRALAKIPGRVLVVDRTAERRPVKAGQLLAGWGELRRERGDEGWTPGWSGGASLAWWRDGGGGFQAGSPAGVGAGVRRDFTRARRSWQVR